MKITLLKTVLFLVSSILILSGIHAQQPARKSNRKILDDVQLLKSYFQSHYPAPATPYPAPKAPYPAPQAPYKKPEYNLPTYPDKKNSYPDKKDSYPDKKDSYPDKKDSYPDKKDSYPDKKDSYKEYVKSYVSGPNEMFHDPPALHSYYNTLPKYLTNFFGLGSPKPSHKPVTPPVSWDRAPKDSLEGDTPPPPSGQDSAPTKPPTERTSEQWTPEKANDWYASQGFLKGANYINADAVNTLEMWQADTYNPQQIDSELKLAATIKFNVLRVFLHNAIYEAEGVAYLDRIEDFLGIADRNGFKVILVFFDSCWNPEYTIGTQPAPKPGVHNSQWVQAPGKVSLSDPATYGGLESWVKDTITRFATDERVLLWDVWNEPNNINTGSYDATELPADQKIGLVEQLLPQVYTWARDSRPSQPITSGVFEGTWGDDATLSPTQRIQLTQSDIITFHDYSAPQDFTDRINTLKRFSRPIVCTEYLARNFGSLFQTHLPIAQQNSVGMVNWGHVNGKTQTNFPWDSYQDPYTDGREYVWQHDIYNNDLTPYIAEETTYLSAA